jgi:hypothetical protein
MKRWMSRPAPRVKFTVNDWLVDNGNNLLWLTIVVFAVAVAGLITVR